MEPFLDPRYNEIDNYGHIALVSSLGFKTSLLDHLDNWRYHLPARFDGKRGQTELEIVELSLFSVDHRLPRTLLGALVIPLHFSTSAQELGKDQVGSQILKY